LNKASSHAKIHSAKIYRKIEQNEFINDASFLGVFYISAKSLQKGETNLRRQTG
jgi:hypothetical protein